MVVENFCSASRLVWLQAVAEFAGQVVDGADFFGRGGRDVGDGHREFAGEEHGGEGLAHLAAHLVLYRELGGALLALAAMERGSDFADQALEVSDSEIDVDRKCRAEVFEDVIGIFGFGLEQELIDDGGGVGLFAEAAGGLLQGLGPMRFFAGGSFQSVHALLAAG